MLSKLSLRVEWIVRKIYPEKRIRNMNNAGDKDAASELENDRQVWRELGNESPVHPFKCIAVSK